MNSSGKSRAGYSSLFLVMVLGSLALVIFVVAEAAAGRAADSITENLTLSELSLKNLR